ncbi:M24 family metallopeptidase [Alicyclobacillus dauci]|uniref:M24 family metallopeptidase n=1 Tax=Alicyclobacillus dauci TaxID=1475485 RepID=A0ABY6Z7P9_9BACL|nr:aminopeptidase P family protein [Alicyclobacillus dauci]WAH38045.1 M24 family metallopeptidase [Alicyclobacillus dauci]
MERQLNSLRTSLRQAGLQGVIITEQPNLSWLYGGRFHVNLASTTGLLSVLVTHDTVECLVPSNEFQRLQDEEGLVADTFHVYDWYDTATLNKRLNDWMSTEGFILDSSWSKSFVRLRSQFDDSDLPFLKSMGRDVARAAEQVCRELSPNDTECAVAARLAAHCYNQGLDPIVVLVAGELRGLLYKHPLPTSNPIGRIVIVSLCARKRGVVMSVTRMVSFSAPSPAITRAYDAVVEIDSRMMASTRPGAPLRDIFETTKQAYGELGFPDEWKRHHQGGLAGYQSRELRLVPDLADEVQASQIYAWNPTIPGVKSEDTIWVGQTENEILTYTGDFPVRQLVVNGRTCLKAEILRR